MNKILLLSAAILTCSMSAWAADQTAALKLAQKSGCLTCHTIDKKIIGPAWQEVGKKYAADPAAAEQLAIKVKKGTQGTWGLIPMPPNVTVKNEDIKTLVAFILTLK